MSESKYWKAIALLTVIGLLYIGHGLHNPASHGLESLPPLISTAKAGSVALPASLNRDTNLPNSADDYPVIVTSSPDGGTIYLWGFRNSSNPNRPLGRQPVFFGAHSAHANSTGQ